MYYKFIKQFYNINRIIQYGTTRTRIWCNQDLGMSPSISLLKHRIIVCIVYINLQCNIQGLRFAFSLWTLILVFFSPAYLCSPCYLLVKHRACSGIPLCRVGICVFPMLNSDWTSLIQIESDWTQFAVLQISFFQWRRKEFGWV